MANDVLAILNDIRDAVAVGGRRGGIDLDAWEEDFIDAVEERLDTKRPLSDKQDTKLREIWGRI